MKVNFVLGIQGELEGSPFTLINTYLNFPSPLSDISGQEYEQYKEIKNP